MIVKLIREFKEFYDNHSVEVVSFGTYFPSDPASLLIEPHGGQLVYRKVEDGRSDLDLLKKLKIRDAELLDCQQIGVGTYSPLIGFMDHATLDSVLENHRLPNSQPWPMPIFLQFHKQQINGLKPDVCVALNDETDTIYAVLDVTEVYSYNLIELSKKWYGTTSHDHPGVANLLSGGEWFVAGNVTLVRDVPSLYKEYDLTPRQSRFIFAHKGWNKVVGFHSRNVIHRVHEYI
ncbi:MAG TPA: hypothetical protein PK959_10365 [Candidatus Competibacteraceae bacterium]|nr:hypothetical protein [Candidatus Competibacteraceae bacterium]